MRPLPCRRWLFAIRGKLRRQVDAAKPLFMAEPLEARRLLSSVLTTSTTVPAASDPADVQATPIADPVFLTSSDISGSSTPYGLTPQSNPRCLWHGQLHRRQLVQRYQLCRHHR